jgi:hypothetical protein
MPPTSDKGSKLEVGKSLSSIAKDARIIVAFAMIGAKI